MQIFKRTDHTQGPFTIVAQKIIAVPLAILCVICVTIGTATAQEPVKVDLELVLAADGSGSIDDEELALQRMGYADAVRDPKILSLMTGGLYEKMVIAYVEWGAAFSVHTIVDWVVIDGPESAEAFAQALISAPRMAQGYNSISSAIDYSVAMIGSNRFQGIRKIIDISGDGPNYGGRPVVEARDEAVQQGITVNALVVKSRGGGYPGPGGMPLDLYYQRDVIGGMGAFVQIADQETSFAEAVRNKMLLEVASAIPKHAHIDLEKTNR